MKNERQVYLSSRESSKMYTRNDLLWFNLLIIRSFHCLPRRKQVQQSGNRDADNEKDDLVISCAIDPDTKLPQIQTGYTVQTGARKGFLNSVDHNIVNRKSSRMSTSNKHLVMACAFTVPKNISYRASVPYPTNLLESLNIFLANGALYPKTPYVSKHNEAPLILAAKAILYSDNISPNKYFSGLYYRRQVHGTLMTVAFIIFLPLAVMIARHFRYNIRVEVYGKQLWFYLHIAFNILFFVFAFAGYFYIISQVPKNWNDSARVHGSVGTVVMILALLNIIMGFSRPDIGTPSRIYFYWSHFVNGTMIRLLAFVTFWLVFFTLVLRTSFKNWMMTVVILWTGVEIIFAVTYALLRRVKGEILAQNVYDTKKVHIRHAQTNHVGIWGLAVYIVCILTLAIALLCGLWLN